MDIAATNWGRSSSTNQQARVRMSLSTLLTKVSLTLLTRVY